MPHDRIHAREPSHDVDRWTVGRIEAIVERDGHAVVTVQPVSTHAAVSDEPVDLVVTLAVRDLFVRRLDLEADESPVGERVWYRVRGE